MYSKYTANVTPDAYRNVYAAIESEKHNLSIHAWLIRDETNKEWQT
jgi:acid stress-induced BolA-like protein IbaG/YrbA